MSEQMEIPAFTGIIGIRCTVVETSVRVIPGHPTVYTVRIDEPGYKGRLLHFDGELVFHTTEPEVVARLQVGALVVIGVTPL